MSKKKGGDEEMSDRMIISIAIFKQRLCQNEPGVLILQINNEEWKELLLKKAFLTIIRTRGDDELCRKIKELLLQEKLALEGGRCPNEPFIALKLPVVLKDGDKVRVFLLQNGVPKNEVFTLTT